jgi:hypothetical protein
MNLLKKLSPEALAKLDQEAIEFPATVAKLKNELMQINHVFEIRLDVVLTLVRCTDISFNIKDINNLFI